MPIRIDEDELARLRREHPELTQRELAERAGVSQATVSRRLRDVPDPDDDPDTDTDTDDDLEDEDDDCDDDPVDEEDAADPPPVDDSLEDLARRIARLERTAARAANKRQFGASVTAQKEAAKMRRELDRLREERRVSTPVARKPDPDEALIADLVSLIGELPDPAFEAVEDAVASRRRRPAEGGRDGR